MTINEKYNQWCTNLYFDTDTKAELIAIADDPAEIRERFYRELEFGTAGIRGILGAGINRMNIYVVRRLSNAIASHLVSQGSGKKRILIGYDSRNYSLEFAKEAASVYAGFGIEVLLSSQICPVPFVSYAVRALKCDAGVMITASHNPKEYNGYKVYGSDGAQLSLSNTEVITKLLLKMDDYTKVLKFDFDWLKSKGKIKYISTQTIDQYFNKIYQLCPTQKGKDDPFEENIKIVYTPLHGAGAKWVPRILEKAKFSNVYTVTAQMEPNGNFPTVNVPNPENSDVYTLALELAKEVNADIILATDPDADRTGVYIKNSKGEYEMINGNQIGVVLLNRLTVKKDKLKNPFVVSTLVSTRLTKAICEKNAIEYMDVLTGFKFIGEKIMYNEEQGDKTFLFGFEESYGYLAGSYARDKDAVASCMLLAEACAYYKNNESKTLLDVLEDIYKEYGYYKETQISINLKGEEGLTKMADLMAALRDKKGDLLSKSAESFMDILTSLEYTFDKDGNQVVNRIDSLPSSNVLYYRYNDSWFCVRPSGTEPKIKIYVGANFADENDTINKVSQIKEELMAKINAILGV